MSDEPETVDLESPDVAAEKQSAFEEMFPGVLADGVLDTTRLGELLDTDVTAPADGRERYGLMWAGKQEAVRSLLTPSRGSLTPALEKSVDFDTAENVFIEGDNLEVLKLMQKAYNDKVKLIYIDPPYNTGNDFVYNDDFRDGLKAYLEYTGQIDDQGSLTSSSANAAGRLHSRWLSMMYPRLVMARNLLTQDGVMFVSIDENEATNLRSLLDEVFGRENFLGQVTVVSNLKGRSDDRFFATAHSYLLVYRRSDEFEPLGVGLETEYVESYKESDDGGQFRYLPLRKSGTNSLRSDRPNMYYPFWVDPTTGSVSTQESDVHQVAVYPKFPDGRDGCWRWGAEGAKARIDEVAGRQVGADRRWDVFQKDYLEKDGVERRSVPKTVWTGAQFDNGRGTAEIKSLLGSRVFDAPKPTGLIARILEYATRDDDIILDFFAGSGTTAHAVALKNSEDGARRRFVLVNLPEETARESAAHKAGYETVSEITLARLQAVIDNVEGASGPGLRTLTLDHSNFHKTVEIDGELDLEDSTLAWEETDWPAIAAEVLLKEGVTLNHPWQRQELSDGEIVIADGVAVVLTLELDLGVVKQALDLGPRVVVFLEDGFAGKDPVKGNAVSSAKALGITMKTV